MGLWVNWFSYWVRVNQSLSSQTYWESGQELWTFSRVLGFLVKFDGMRHLLHFHIERMATLMGTRILSLILTMPSFKRASWFIFLCLPGKKSILNRSGWSVSQFGFFILGPSTSLSYHSFSVGEKAMWEWFILPNCRTYLILLVQSCGGRWPLGMGQ